MILQQFDRGLKVMKESSFTLHCLGLRMLIFDLTLNAANKLRRSKTAPKTKSITNEVKLRMSFIIVLMEGFKKVIFITLLWGLNPPPPVPTPKK